MNRKKFSSHHQSNLWHKSKNLPATPDTIGLSSHNTFWFTCDVCKHDFQAIPHNAKKGIKCKHCSGDQFCGNKTCNICYKLTFASYLEEETCPFLWDNNKNIDETVDDTGNKIISLIDPLYVSKFTNKDYSLLCKKCNHSQYVNLSSKSKGGGCGYCANQLLCTDEGCTYCYNKSLKSYLDDKKCPFECDNINSRLIFKGSDKKEYPFKCKNFPDIHVYSSTVYNIVTTNLCPCCSLQSKILCDKQACEGCFKKSFASDQHAEYWDHDKNGKVTPRMKLKGSDNEKYWFKCNICQHSFQKTLYSITGQDTWCPFCCFPPLNLCDNQDCKECFKKSFDSDPKAVYWNYKKNGTITPRQVFKHSNLRFHFICENGHDCCMQLNNIASGYWCASCVNKTEDKLYSALSPIYPELRKQFKVEWCKSKTYLPFDFVLLEYKIVIELDGPQHFRVIHSKWRSPEDEQKNDKYKMDCANQNGYSVIRILQEDVYYNTVEWLEALQESIQTIITEGIVQNICISSNNDYEKYQ